MVERTCKRAAYACVVLWAFATAVGAQQESRDSNEAPTLEERVAELERAVAGIDTRLTARTTGRPEQGQALNAAVLEQRVAQLERTITMLRADIQRTEQTAAAALRTASDAQRTAASAEREARAAASRF
jgi:hypothetical protein